LNPGRRGGKPATNRFSYGAAETELPCDQNISAVTWLMKNIKEQYSGKTGFSWDEVGERFQIPWVKDRIWRKTPLPSSFSLPVKRKGEKNNEKKTTPSAVDVGGKWSECEKPRITCNGFERETSRIKDRRAICCYNAFGGNRSITVVTDSL
jgi:hypothetical protein